MLFLARREIAHNKIRFALFTALVGLVSFLVFVMTGLSTGLGEASISGLRALTAESDLVVFAPSVQRSLGRSDVDVGAAATIRTTPGVTAVAPVGQSMVNLTTRDDHTVSVALVGVPPDTPLVSHVPPAGGIVLADSARGELAIGDDVRVQPGGQRLTVTGFADLGSLQHTPVAYTSLATWQQLRFATSASGAVAPNRASAFLVRVDGGRTQDVAAALAGDHLDPATPGGAIAASPGFKEETGTINLIRGFLFGIAALLVGTVFWVLTLQKEPAIAVLRAAGARRALLLSAHAIQVAATTAAGVIVGLGVATLAAAALPASAYVLTLADVAIAGALLIALALGASVASMRRTFTVDPLVSLGNF